MGRKGRGWILKTYNPACAPKPTHKEQTSGFQDIGPGMGRESVSLAIASFVCSVGPWSLEASARCLGLGSQHWRYRWCEPSDAQRTRRKWELGLSLMMAIISPLIVCLATFLFRTVELISTTFWTLSSMVTAFPRTELMISTWSIVFWRKMSKSRRSPRSPGKISPSVRI